MPGLSPDELVRELNHVFAEEVEAANRYLHLLSAVRGLDRLTVEPVLKEGYRETVEHAIAIGQKIRTLGAVPELRISIECPATPMSGREALATALTFEEAALDAYKDLLRKVEGDVVIEEFVRSQIAIESQHVAELKELLD